MALRRLGWSQMGSPDVAFWGVGESGRAPLKDWRGWLWRVLTVGWLWLGMMAGYENGKYLFALDAHPVCVEVFYACFSFVRPVCWIALIAACYFWSATADRGAVRLFARWAAGARKPVKTP